MMGGVDVKYWSLGVSLKTWVALMFRVCVRGSFTWFNGTGTSMRRLDRFLLSKSLVVDWKYVGQVVGKRDISYRCPIWLKGCNENWCPNNSWLKHPHFQLFIKKEWQSFKIKGGEILF